MSASAKNRKLGQFTQNKVLTQGKGNLLNYQNTFWKYTDLVLFCWQLYMQYEISLLIIKGGK